MHKNARGAKRVKVNCSYQGLIAKKGLTSGEGGGIMSMRLWRGGVKLLP